MPKRRPDKSVPSSALTQAQKIDQLRELLGKNFKHWGELFTPSSNFYPTELDDAGLQAMGRQLLGWLGLRPVGLKIRFAPELSEASSYQALDGEHVIMIQERYRHLPFECAGILARLLLHYVIKDRRQSATVELPNYEELLDLATLYSGLGLVTLNAAPGGDNWSSRLRLSLGRFGRIQMPALGFYSAKQYGQLFKQYVDHFRLEPATWSPYLLPWARRWLPRAWRPAAKATRPSFVATAEQHLRVSNLKILGLVFVLVALVGLSWYVSSLRPKRLPPVLQAQYDQIEVLRQAYDACRQSVVAKQRQYDQSDLFLLRQIEAVESRCTSLRNRYNYAVEQYNAALKQLN